MPMGSVPAHSAAIPSARPTIFISNGIIMAAELAAAPPQRGVPEEGPNRNIDRGYFE
jgi:hypothetical protein